jgi:beta-lactamase regulating signal transducer with metallopeptidase domain
VAAKGPAFTAAPNATESSTGGVPLTSPESMWLKMRHRNRPVSFAPLLTQILASGYLGFVLYRGLCLCWAWRRTRVIVRSTTRCFFPPLQGVIVERCCSSFGLQNVHIACSRELQGPVVLGVRYPALVLPEWFVANGSEEELASALCHELAHIRRRDFLLNLVYEALLLPISLHPLAWLIKKQIGQTRELASMAPLVGRASG